MSRPAHSIGTEHEKFGFRTADKRSIDYAEVKHLLLGLVNRRAAAPRPRTLLHRGSTCVSLRARARRFGWEPIMENEFIIGAKLDGQSVTLEPGGQFELSGASPCASACAREAR